MGPNCQTKTAAFQSHAGSIEATTRNIITSAVQACFNPTLVRLRQAATATTAAAAMKFQSHAGSIEARRSRLST